MEVASFLTIIMSWSKVLPPWSTVPTAAAGGCILFDVFFDTAAWLSLLLGVPRLRALPTSSGTFVACIGAVQSSTSMRAVVVMQRRSLWRAAFMWFFNSAIGLIQAPPFFNKSTQKNIISLTRNAFRLQGACPYSQCCMPFIPSCLLVCTSGES